MDYDSDMYDGTDSIYSDDTTEKTARGKSSTKPGNKTFFGISSFRMIIFIVLFGLLLYLLYCFYESYTYRISNERLTISTIIRQSQRKAKGLSKGHSVLNDNKIK
jgi:hypothetical protein